jgi:hypothetical protein
MLGLAGTLAAQEEQVNRPIIGGIAAELTVGDMTAGSDVIVLGKCTGLESIWIDRILVTLATVSVSETLKGTTGETITVVLPGGSDSNRKFPVAMTYPGAPQMTSGEDVFLFLVRDTDFTDGLIVAGFSQGKFSVVESEEGEKLVSRDLSTVRLQNNSGLKRGTRYLTPLSEFKQAVRASLP